MWQALLVVAVPEIIKAIGSYCAERVKAQRAKDEEIEKLNKKIEGLDERVKKVESATAR